MTLQSLLHTKTSNTLTEEELETRRTKTAALLAANKAAAASILLTALSNLESNSPYSTRIEKKIWI